MKHDGRFIALIGDDGEALRSKATPVAAIKAARDRIIAAPVEPVNSVTVAEICDAYLAKVKADGADATLKARGDTLFDFCHGLPPRFRGKIAKPCDYIHRATALWPPLSFARLTWTAGFKRTPYGRVRVAPESRRSNGPSTMASNRS